MHTEVNFDSLVGPTHNYGGLSKDNCASKTNTNISSNPRAAALQCLDKIRLLHSLGVRQCVLPPPQRPVFSILRQLGYQGTDAQVVDKVGLNDPELLKLCYSASTMWAANSATVSADIDCFDGKVHITTANLSHCFHRSLEAEFTHSLYQRIFWNEKHFSLHAPLPRGHLFQDEGAANVMRLGHDFQKEGLNVFVYGYDPYSTQDYTSNTRHSLLACSAIARKHRLNPERTVFIQQGKCAVANGAFHNDVIATSHEGLLLFHENSFENPSLWLDKISTLYGYNPPLKLVQVSSHDIPLQDAISSYFFNSQIVRLPDTNTLALIAPVECHHNERVNSYISSLMNEHKVFEQKHFVDLRQSMKNGGGPACLRLRVPMHESAWNSIPEEFKFSDEKYIELGKWINKYYRDRLNADDLRDPLLVDEVMTALDKLTQLLDLPSIYDFQRI